MMTVEEWRNRAHACKVAAERSSSPDSRLGWQELADAWLYCAELREGAKDGRKETPSMVLAGGEQLRARLALVK
jgi:hypothetical protein